MTSMLTERENKLIPDIQTGRAVYVDEDLYQNDDDYKARIDQYVHEGFHIVFGTPDTPSGGGGGSSDFSTAQVTVKNSGDSKEGLFFPSVIVIDNVHNVLTQEVLQPNSGGDKIYSIVLYQGSALLEVSPGAEEDPITEISGAIATAEGAYIITGDCTITMDETAVL